MMAMKLPKVAGRTDKQGALGVFLFLAIFTGATQIKCTKTIKRKWVNKSHYQKRFDDTLTDSPHTYIVDIYI